MLQKEVIKLKEGDFITHSRYGICRVKGERTLEQYLEIALRKYSKWSDQKIIDYKFSHGHCVKSKY